MVTKVLLGVVAVWPLCLGSLGAFLLSRDAPDPRLVRLFPLVMVASISAQLVCYIVWLSLSRSIPTWKKFVWTIVLVFTHMLGVPVFYWIHVLRSRHAP